MSLPFLNHGLIQPLQMGKLRSQDINSLDWIEQRKLEEMCASTPKRHFKEIVTSETGFQQLWVQIKLHVK